MPVLISIGFHYILEREDNNQKYLIFLEVEQVYYLGWDMVVWEVVGVTVVDYSKATKFVVAMMVIVIEVMPLVVDYSKQN